MEPAAAPLATILELDTDLLLNCLADLTEAESLAQLPGGGNSLMFLAAHLTDTRHYLATWLGRPLDNPVAACLAGARTIADIRSWPSLDQIRTAWIEVGRHVVTTLADAGADALGETLTHPLSLDGTRLGLVAFLVQHDAYHVGQAAFLRRQLGRPAMSYARGARLETGRTAG
jgi:uncharacterized damage-inducible protein DinB